jgi:hypothetical protein
MNVIRFLLLLAGFTALNLYIYIRGRQALPDKFLVQAVYTAVFLIASLAILLAIFLGNRLPGWMALVFEYAGGYYIILFIFLVSFTLLGDLLRIVHHYLHIFPAWVSTHYDQVKILYFGFVLLTLFVISLIGFLRFSNPEVMEFEIKAKPEANHTGNFTVVAASDLHLGNLIRRERLADWVELINRQNPDIILFAGDIFDHSYDAVVSQKMDLELLKLKATYGVYAVPGNHDYYAGIDRVLDFLKRSGIRVLRDSTVTIDNQVILIGRDDRTNPQRKSLDVVMDSVSNGLPKILLDHQPGSLEESAQQGIDLHISGHTHNGQIFPYNKLVSKIYGLGYGYRQTDGTHFYVSSGLGLWGAPIRLGTQSEIAVFRIK